MNDPREREPEPATDTTATAIATSAGGSGGTPEEGSAPSDSSSATGATGPKRSGGGGLILIGIAILILVVGVLTGPYWSPYVARYVSAPVDEKVTGLIDSLNAGQSTLQTQLQALQGRVQKAESAVDANVQRLEAMASQVAGLSSTGGSGSAAPVDLSGVNSRLDKLEAAVAGIDQNKAGITEIQQRLQTIQDRLGRLETDAVRTAAVEQRVRTIEESATASREGTARAMATLLAVGQLTDATRTAGAYTNELNALRMVAGEDAGIGGEMSKLAPYAASGVPTVRDLTVEFPAVARGVLHAQAGMSGEGWGERVVNRVMSLVTIRRTGEGAIEGGGTDAALARAEAALSAGDLGGAVQAMRTIDGAGATAATSWIEKAEARIAVNQAISALHDQAISRLSQAQG